MLPKIVRLLLQHNTESQENGHSLRARNAREPGQLLLCLQADLAVMPNDNQRLQGGSSSSCLLALGQDWLKHPLSIIRLSLATGQQSWKLLVTVPSPEASI